MIVAVLAGTLVWCSSARVRANERLSSLSEFDGAASAAPADGLWTLPPSPRFDLILSETQSTWVAREGQVGAAPPVEAPREHAVITSPRFRVPAEPWCWQILPNGLIYRSYLAGAKEPRFASAWAHERELGWIWDVALGGRVGLLRYGTQDSLWPEGWQLDIEGAALPRLVQDNGWILMASDFRFGIPLTYGCGRFRTKFGYYHLSSHLGDEYMLLQPSVRRLNYARDAILWGNSFYWTNDLRLYAEAAWAFSIDDGAEPWEFQFGIDYSPARATGRQAAPFIAINGHLREELNFGGNLSLQTGYMWRGPSGHMFRFGMQYYVGQSDQYEFFNRFENKIGFGIWYDY